MSAVSIVPTPPSPPLGTLLTSWGINDSEESTVQDSGTPHIQNCKYVGSYNWLDAHAPAIIIPGLPPTWTPPHTAPQLQLDSGAYFRDINAARYAAHPMEPAVRAVMNEGLLPNSNTIDIFGCSSTLGNLFRFIRQENKPFRMIVEIVGNTVFLIRRENSPRELIQGIYGYGHTMPETYTTWQKEVEGSESHQRIIKYNFAGLECLLRFEVDGYLPKFCPDLMVAPAEKNEEAVGINKEGEENPIESLGSNASGAKVTKNEPLLIQYGGAVVPQSSLFDLKTRSQKRRGEGFLGERLPRLWLTQVPNFVLGFHDRGRFDEVVEKNVQEDIEKWAEQNSAKLRNFGSLLQKIVSFAREKAEMRIELEHAGVGNLNVRSVGGEASECLPPELKEQ